MFREVISSSRSIIQTAYRRAISSLGHGVDEETGIPAHRLVLDNLKRKFGSRLQYILFGMTLLLFFAVITVSSSLEIKNPTSANSGTVQRSQPPPIPDNQLRRKNPRTNPNFFVTIVATFFIWLSLINLLRYIRAWILLRTSANPTNQEQQHDNLLLLQRLLLFSRSDPSGLPSRLRLALMQRDFTGDDYELLQQLDNGNSPQPQRGATDGEINRLPVHLVSQADLEASQIEEATSSYRSCSICLAPFEVGEEVRTTRCMHQFHKPCIDRWLRANAVCPVCKFPATD